MAELKLEGVGGRRAAAADDAASRAQGSVGRLGGHEASNAGLKGTGRATSSEAVQEDDDEEEECKCVWPSILASPSSPPR